MTKDTGVIKEREETELLALLNNTVEFHPERMAVLFQIIFAMTQERWTDLQNLTLTYGTYVKKNDIFERKLFVTLMLYAYEKQLQNIG